MAFVSITSAIFTKLLIRQIAAIVQRDIGAALQTVAGTGNTPLPVPAEYNLVKVAPMTLPSMIVAVVHDKQDRESIRTVKHDVEIHCEITAGNQDPNALSENIQDYIRALHYVLATAGENFATDQADFYKSLSISLGFLASGSTTTAMPLGSITHFQVVSHEYGEALRPKDKFLMVGAVILSVGMEEPS